MTELDAIEEVFFQGGKRVFPKPYVTTYRRKAKARRVLRKLERSLANTRKRALELDAAVDRRSAANGAW